MEKRIERSFKFLISLLLQIVIDDCCFEAKILDNFTEICKLVRRNNQLNWGADLCWFGPETVLESEKIVCFNFMILLKSIFFNFLILVF